MAVRKLNLYPKQELLRKLLLVVVASIFVFAGNIQSGYCQPSLHDSLNRMLSYFEEKAKDDTLQKAIKEAKILYSSKTISDSLSKKLLVVDSVLVNSQELNQSKVLSFTTKLLQLFMHLPGKQDHPYYATGLNNLALLYFANGRYSKALPLYQQVLAIRKNLGEEHIDYSTSLNNLANLYLYMGKYDIALPLFQKALAIRKKTLGEKHPEYATVLNRLALLYFQLGQYDKALPLYEQALAIRNNTSGETHPDYANSLNNLALLYYVIGQYDKALPLYERALAIKKKTSGEEFPEHSNILNRMALLYFEMGQYDKALPLFEQALTIRRKISGEEHAEYATIVNNFALLYFSMGQYDEAEQLYERALAIRKKTLGENHPLYANSLNNLANLYSSTGQYEKALTLFRQALSIRKKVLGENHSEYAVSLNNLALLYFTMGEYNQAAAIYKEALEIKKRVFGEQHPDYAISLNNLANLYSATDQYKKALPLLQQSLAIRKKALGEEHPDYATSLNNLANLYAETGNYVSASTLFIQASDITLRHLNQTYGTLSEQEKMKMFKIKSSQFDFLPSLLFNQSVDQPSVIKQVYTNALALKGMVLENQQVVLNSIRRSGDSTALQLFEQWRSNKTFIGRQLLLPKSMRKPYLDQLQDVTNQIEQQLSRRTASFNNLQHRQAISVHAISENLQKDEAAVEFITFRLYHKKWTDSIMYAALILLPGDSIPRFIPLFEEKRLQNILKSASKQVNAAAAIRKLYAEDSLYQMIWKPLEKYFAGVHTVYYAPAGLLHRIAFKALGTDISHPLIDNYHIKQLLSTRSIALPFQATKRPASAEIWANIDYGAQTQVTVARGTKASRGQTNITTSFFNFYASDTRNSRSKDWRRLTGTKQEMQSITQELYKVGTLTSIDSGSTATEEKFKAMDGKSPQLLHLATHGFFLPVAEGKSDNNYAGNNVFIVQQNPMLRSGLVLAGANYVWNGGTVIKGKEDGILTAYEIAQMDLRNTDLVVLSACETALGDLQVNEGVIGLQRAFKLAGVKQLILSLWRVPDKETAELMKMFYSNWLSGKSTSEALRSAQLKMKEKYPPYFWAAFVVVE